MKSSQSVVKAAESLWQEQAWYCPQCQYSNLAVRRKCRNCSHVRQLAGLSFPDLAQANLERCEASFHPLEDWSPADWAMAAAGELGEAFNLLKKSRRKEYTEMHLDRQAIAHELADTVIYIDLLCQRLGIKLGDAVVEKFDIVSDRVGSTIKLAAK